MARKNPIAYSGQSNYVGSIVTSDPRANLEDLIRKNGHDFAAVSKMLGKNPAYIQQYIRRGSPRKLDENDRRRLAEFYGVEEDVLGAPKQRAAGQGGRGASSALLRIRQLQVGASAGPGSLADDEYAESMGFGPKWLRRLGLDPADLSLIAVDGDSMQPTLGDGDDIMVDHSASSRPLRDGIYVLRMDDVLLVKRVAMGPSGKLSIRSDNPQYPDWDDVSPESVNIIGRVVWTGRRL
ncbi:helix-turn-helix transcriptional regulator [Parasphingorhabdus flavimaris]|uniref:Helix-turn-helix transcriptional regulator n=1 Tax=Parasphingorhabdus flavimaris TaxID=266812 RepID=A0ABX2N3C6_9SPHN|nr:helix-turn-helix transcriptional regulator [Parasphingorhabdus flavimaris]